MNSDPRDTCTFEIRPSAPDTVTIFLHGDLVIDTAHALFKNIRPEIRQHAFENALIDIAGVNRLDDYGAMVISEIRNMTGTAENKVEVTGIRPDHQKIFDITDFDRSTLCPITLPASPNIIVQAGASAINTFKGFIYFISFIGAIVISVARVVKHPRSLRYGDIVTHMKTTGVDAVPIVGLISLMLGLIIAFVSSMQLKVYGANLYVANLVAVAMVQELGPIMTAIVVAGRSGSAYAAEISTMKISEEVDALYVMGFDPNLFLVLPRLIAAVLVVPVLTMFSNLFAIAGGAIIGATMLDVSMDTYINQSINAIKLFELMWGLFKSSVFAVLIALTGCLRGFQARGGAASVGNATTSAVVTAIFLIILFDSIFAIVRIYWG
ncbi:MAG: MlaE family lipid ABC transporter permease subunit [Desulfosalsimonadaceae bacterium]